MWNGLDVSWPWNVPLIGLILLCLPLWLWDQPRSKKRKTRHTPQKKSHRRFYYRCIVDGNCISHSALYIARTQLFFAHMVQAVTLTTFCAPLLLFSAPAWLLNPYWVGQMCDQ